MDKNDTSYKYNLGRVTPTEIQSFLNAFWARKKRARQHRPVAGEHVLSINIIFQLNRFAIADGVYADLHDNASRGGVGGFARVRAEGAPTAARLVKPSTDARVNPPDGRHETVFLLPRPLASFY